MWNVYYVDQISLPFVYTHNHSTDIRKVTRILRVTFHNHNRFCIFFMLSPCQESRTSREESHTITTGVLL